MRVEYIAIGDELLNGRTADKNGNWLAKKLNATGLELKKMSFIEDDLPLIIRAMEKALDRADLVITSGGIGPTQDDLTKLALAGLFQSEILENENAKNIAEENYQRFGKSWSPDQNNYHQIPEKVTPLKNPKGLAPGLCGEKNGSWIFSTPGVPREFHSMVDEIILPFMKEKSPLEFKQFQKVEIRTKEIPEEKIYSEVSPNLWKALGQFGKVSSLPESLGIDIVIHFEGDETKRANTLKEIQALPEIIPLRPWIWQWGNLSPAEFIISEATKKSLTIATAESCTGGRVASLLTDVPGSSSCYLGTVVSYSNQVKINQLNVNLKTLQTHGAVSEQTALEMAMGIQKLLGADLTISTSGIAGPAGGSSEKPVGTIAIGASSKERSFSFIKEYPGDRDSLKERFATKALFTLIDMLID